MSDAAAFEATYSDWRVVKGRKVVQVVFEFPLEYSDKVYSVLGGMPNPAAEVWVGVARLDPKVRFPLGGSGEDRDDSLKSGRHALTSETNSTEGAAPGQLTKPARSNSQNAFLLCNQPSGRLFLERRRRHAIPADNHINNVDEAKHVLRAWLQIDSLSELDRDPKKAEQWERIDADYKTWLTAARYVPWPGEHM